MEPARVASYSPQELWDAVDEQRADRAARDAARSPRTSRSTAPRWPGGRDRVELREWQQESGDWVAANNDCRRDILERLRADGPLPSSELPDTCVRAVALERLERQPERHDDARLAWCSAARSPRPGDRAATGSGTSPRGSTPTTRRVPLDGGAAAARRAPARRARHRPGDAARSVRSSRSTSARPASRPSSRGSAGEWRVDPAQLGQPFAGRAALLSPFDRLLARPQADGRALRVRLHPRDVQARRRAPVGLLRPPDPVRRPAGREARRQGRA